MIGPQRERRDWWDWVALCIANEVFEGQVSEDQLNRCADLLRGMVKVQQDIFPHLEAKPVGSVKPSIADLAQEFLKRNSKVG